VEGDARHGRVERRVRCERHIVGGVEACIVRGVPLREVRLTEAYGEVVWPSTCGARRAQRAGHSQRDSRRTAAGLDAGKCSHGESPPGEAFGFGALYQRLLL
jgi:hypothetical protein